MKTMYDTELSDALVGKYLTDLVNRFYKILPIRENEEKTIEQYLESLLREMLGFKSLIIALQYDDRYITLLSILQYFIDEKPDVSKVKSDVFKAINILKKLQKKYCNGEG